VEATCNKATATPNQFIIFDLNVLHEHIRTLQDYTNKALLGYVYIYIHASQTELQVI